MIAEEISTMWLSAFGVIPPAGYACRDKLGARWLRIHSLPESKRYPETEAEHRELLRRHNDVATAVLGEGEACVLFATTFAERGTIPETGGLRDIQETRFTRIPALSTNDATVAAAPVVWRRSFFDTLILSVAEDTSGPVLFANFGRCAAYAPYDGGADLFVDRAESVALLKDRWSGWLSARADGL